MNGLIICSSESGILLFNEEYVKCCGLGPAGADSMQLCSTLFTLYQMSTSGIDNYSKPISSFLQVSFRPCEHIIFYPEAIILLMLSFTCRKGDILIHFREHKMDVGSAFLTITFFSSEFKDHDATYISTIISEVTFPLYNLFIKLSC